METAVTSEPDWQVFAAWVLGDRPAASALLRDGVTLEPTAFREMLLMLHLFAGVPRALEAAAGVAEARPELLPPPEAEVRLEGDEPERGWSVFRGVYGDKAPAVLARLRSLHADLAHWVIDHAYGRVLGRPGLALLDRELLAVAGLAALGTEPQLESHARGALRNGASPELVARVIASLRGRVPEASWRGADAFTRRIAG